jgi:hypothetical protein
MQDTKETRRDYDSDLQMFRRPPQDPAPASLRFLRWLAYCGELEHEVVGPPAGAYAASFRGTEPVPAENPNNETAKGNACDLITESAHEPASPSTAPRSTGREQA